MHSVLWAGILASAGVTLVTTLAVENLAKPGLEACKERILENNREWRTAVPNLALSVVYLLMRVALLLTHQMNQTNICCALLS